jgi:hypothetical protein
MSPKSLAFLVGTTLGMLATTIAHADKFDDIEQKGTIRCAATLDRSR